MQPKKNFVPIKFKDPTTGYARHRMYAKEILHKEKNFPKPLEYEDIDVAFTEFINTMVDMADPDGKKIPTFTLYSNQRFSEYSQTWEHTDELGNLLMNFKTVSRANNPQAGSNQGTRWNIPGDRYYTILQKTVLDDNGNENVEIYSMKQPYSVDLIYRVNFVTNTFTMINEFNSKVNELFKARQCYIRPNGHFLPMNLESVDDETSYTVEERKFFTQSITIKVLAYIIHNDDFKVSKYSKQPRLYADGDAKHFKRPIVEIEEEEHVGENKKVNLVVKFKPFTSKAEFDIDADIDFKTIEYDNIRALRFFVNDVPCYIERGFKVKNGDNIKIKIFQTDTTLPSTLTLYGIDPNIIIGQNEELPENASSKHIKEETLFVD